MPLNILSIRNSFQKQFIRSKLISREGKIEELLSLPWRYDYKMKMNLTLSKKCLNPSRFEEERNEQTKERHGTPLFLSKL